MRQMKCMTLQMTRNEVPHPIISQLKFGENRNQKSRYLELYIADIFSLLCHDFTVLTADNSNFHTILIHCTLEVFILWPEG